MSIILLYPFILFEDAEKEKSKRSTQESPHFYIIEILFNLKVYHRHNRKQDI